MNQRLVVDKLLYVLRVDVRCYGVSECEELVEAVTREWWSWRESSLFQQVGYKYMILSTIIISIKYTNGTVLSC